MDAKASQIPHSGPLTQMAEIVDVHRSTRCEDPSWYMESNPPQPPRKVGMRRRMDDADVEVGLGQTRRLTSIWRRMDDAEMDTPLCQVPYKASIWRRMDDAESE